MAAILVAIGWWAVRRSSAWLCVALGVVLWLAAMLVALPLTGAGIFATALLAGPLLIDAAYACVFGTYGAVLALGTALLTRQPSERHIDGSASLQRRSLLAGLGGIVVSVVAFGVARSAAVAGPAAQSSLPL